MHTWNLGTQELRWEDPELRLSWATESFSVSKQKEIQGTTALTTTTTTQSDPWRRKKIFLSHLKSSGCLNWGKLVFCCCCRKISSYKILTSQVGPGLMDATNPGRSGVSGSILYRHQTLPRAALHVPWETWWAPAAFLLSTMPGS